MKDQAALRRSKSRVRYAVVGGLIVIGLLTYLVWPNGPSYQGRALDSWLLDLRWDGGRNERHDKAVNALKQMGTSAFPPLVRMLDATDSRFKSKLMDTLEERSLGSPFVTAETHRHRALAAFRSLGPDARAAIPMLVELLRKPEPNPDAVDALLCIGPEAAASMADALGKLNSTVRYAVINHVGSKNENYPAMIPLLVASLKEEDRYMRWTATMFLSTHPVAAEQAVPALTERLSDIDPGVRQMAGSGLRNYGVAAKSAVPALLKALNDPNPMVRSIATNALQAIDPEALKITSGK